MNHIAQSLSLKYKGDRDYLHGTDIISALLDITGSIKKMSIRFHKNVSKNLIVHFIDLESLEQFRLSNEICVLMSYQKSGDMKIAVATEGSENINERLEYNEEDVVINSEIYGHKIIQNKPDFGSLIERIVALNKKLLNNLYENKSWFFTQIDLDEYYVNTVKLTIEFDRSIGGLMYKTILYVDEKKAGSIIFSRNK